MRICSYFVSSLALCLFLAGGVICQGQSGGG
jgi:hypothetical protein